jgi:hypothetical protein
LPSYFCNRVEEYLESRIASKTQLERRKRGILAAKKKATKNKMARKKSNDPNEPDYGTTKEEWNDRGGAGRVYVEPQDRCICCRFEKKSGEKPDERKCKWCKKNNIYCSRCDGLFRYEEGLSRRLVAETSMGTLWIEVSERVRYFEFSSIVPRGSQEVLFPLESTELIPHRNTDQFIRIRDVERLEYGSELDREDLATAIDRKIHQSEIPCFSSREKKISHEYFIFGPEIGFVPPPYRPIDDGLYSWYWKKNDIYPKDQTEERMRIISSLKRGDVLNCKYWQLASWERGEEKRPDTSVEDPAYWGFLGASAWAIVSKGLPAISNPDHALLAQTLSRLNIDWQTPVMGHVINGHQVLDSFTSAPCEIETKAQREYHGDAWHYDPRLEIPVEHTFLQPKGLFVKNVYFVQCQEDAPCDDDAKCRFFFAWKSGSPKGRAWLFDQTVDREERTFGDLRKTNDISIWPIESLRGASWSIKGPKTTAGASARGNSNETPIAVGIAQVREQLESWKSMLDDGLIDEQDYEKKKNDLLGKK